MPNINTNWGMDGWIESGPVKKDLGILLDEKFGMDKVKCSQEVKEGNSPPQFCSDETPDGVLHQGRRAKRSISSVIGVE
ncbi:hypothetical protein llap_9528 [Limosa lapponica baueri]|uniref:Rna-directed dna polymerase from mobile element jockey-like n=1 Tax=Limosa lapponica baueri TaxID=1758121 RepID=A0A2I0U279_LIMLA|nr:hypothetical protein llap_9528 [Limosa lapponica baueri]